MDKNTLRNISYGMYVIGAKDDERVGCIANSLIQITSDPVTIAVSINKDNYTHQIIKKTKKFSVAILKENIDKSIIGTFGYNSSRDINKYKNVAYEEIGGIPVINDNCGYLICDVIDQMDTSTHIIFLAEVVEMQKNEGTPMTYKYYQEVLKGKSPKNAPTYVDEENKTIQTVWKCTICGHEAEVEELPDDYICPICGMPKSAFEKISK